MNSQLNPNQRHPLCLVFQNLFQPTGFRLFGQASSHRAIQRQCQRQDCSQLIEKLAVGSSCLERRMSFGVCSVRLTETSLSSIRNHLPLKRTWCEHRYCLSCELTLRIHQTESLRAEDLDRRANILNKWWTGLIEICSMGAIINQSQELTGL